MLYSSNNLHYFIASSSFLLSFASFAFNIPRLQQSLAPSDGLSDEHVLIAAYVSQLQSSTRLVLGKQIVWKACGVHRVIILFPFKTLLDALYRQLGWPSAHPLKQMLGRSVINHFYFIYICLKMDYWFKKTWCFFLKERSVTKCYEEKKGRFKNEMFVDALVGF